MSENLPNKVQLLVGNCCVAFAFRTERAGQKGTRGPWLKRLDGRPGKARTEGESGRGKRSIAKGSSLYLRGDRCPLEGALISAGVWHGSWFFRSFYSF